MKQLKIWLICLLLTATAAYAEQGNIGFTANVSVSGVIKPELLSMTVKAVSSGSAAEKAGLKAGDEIMAIDDCAIPGCPVHKAQQLMKKKAGEKVGLLIKSSEEPKQLVIALE